MSAEIKKEIQLEIAHVLFIDIVGYSKLSINEQRATGQTIFVADAHRSDGKRLSLLSAFP
jgi:hypothetical protein